MTNTVISVENLTKQYDLGVIGTGTISRDLNRWFARVRKQPDPYTRIGQQDAFARIGETILALDDVSFQVQQGEVLGIIGRNGAGKSTLLKILSRVTAPTSGAVKVKGRIGSLLEVGTGFHPELTGRENVYLNGAILGMKKAEVTRKFDEIVEFAGVQKFIDTPVKRYSSGMYVRLAFAVAAHLESEILIVDEVLAVGDAEFQKKCLGKMGDVSFKEGRTVLFVSHNMAAIQELCPKAILIQSGQIGEVGPSSDVVSNYLNIYSLKNGDPFQENNPNRSGSGVIRLVGGRLLDSNGIEVTSLIAGQDVSLEFDFHNYGKVESANINLTIYNQSGIPVTNTSTFLTIGELTGLPEKGKFRCILKRIPFPLGSYRIAIGIQTPDGVADHIPQSLSFSVESSIYYPSLRTPDNRYATVMVDHRWTII